MVAGTPGGLGLHPLKPTLLEIQFIDEYVDNPHRVILRNIIVEMFRKQRALTTIFAFDKSLHQSLPLLGSGRLYAIKLNSVFTQPRSDEEGQTDLDKEKCGMSGVDWKN